MQKRFDVAVLGGGLAGLTVALQIKQERPETEIIVIERNAHPVPEAAFKVGESVLEGAASYFAETLGLKEHLETQHFFKAGLRFFTSDGDNSQIETRPEIGTVRIFEDQDTVSSFQIDRGRFENKLGEMIRTLGVTFWDGSRITDIRLNDHGNDHGQHTVTVDHDGSAHTIAARWVIDASGRAALLRRQLGLSEEVSHHINAAWLRVNQRFNTNLWSRKLDWRRRVDSSVVRIFATSHLCGPGYWVWIIPLAPETTSIGIVADERLHPSGTFNKLDRALEWLRIHEPQCAQMLDQSQIQDFKVLRNYTNSCRQVYSTDQWCITGVAGAFTDPLYSPGSEFIAMSNTFVTDIITRSLDGEAVEERISFYDRFVLDFMFSTSIREYLGQYPNLNDPLFITLKEVWHAAWYWGIWGVLIHHPKQLRNLALMSEIEPDLERFSALHLRMQEMFRNWPVHGRTYSNLFVDYLAVDSVFHLHTAMIDPLTDGELREQIAGNVAFLEMVAHAILAYVQPESLLDAPLTPATPEIAAEFKTALWDVFEASLQKVPPDTPVFA